MNPDRTTRSLGARLGAVLCTALLTTGAMAGPKLQTIDVTPTAKMILVAQKQTFTATGTFSNGSKHALGPAISDIAAGDIDTCALLTSGGVECWGNNANGELGDGTTTNSLIPRRVKGIKTATAVSFSKISQDHGCALLASGAIQCWGFNALGQLGNGTSSVFESTPVTVSAISTATAVATGGYNSCALLASGAVQCWGWNHYGQLGDGTNTDSNVPMPVTGLSTAIALTTGERHSCALLASGAIRCWGLNDNGQLGNGTKTDSNTPVTVSGISNATAVVAGGGYTSCALLASGAIQCWGANDFGQLGNGSTTPYSSIPVLVSGISTAIAITAGYTHVCAVLRGGAVKCWGANGSGQLGTGAVTAASNIPVRVQETNAPVRLAAGRNHTCALFAGGLMTCWGSDRYGQLGNRRANYKLYPLPINVIGTPGVMWASSDPTKATITDRGVATGRAVGNTMITATTPKFINDNAVLTVK